MKYKLMGILFLICGCSSTQDKGEEQCIQNGDGQYVIERTRKENQRIFEDGGQEEDVNFELGRQVAALERRLAEAEEKPLRRQIVEVQVFCFGTRPNRNEQLWFTPLDNPGQSSRAVSLTPLLDAKPDACGFYQLNPPVRLPEGQYQVDNYRGNRHSYQVSSCMSVQTGTPDTTFVVVTPKGRRFRVPCDGLCIILVPRGYSINRIVRSQKNE